MILIKNCLHFTMILIINILILSIDCNNRNNADALSFPFYPFTWFPFSRTSLNNTENADSNLNQTKNSNIIDTNNYNMSKYLQLLQAYFSNKSQNMINNNNSNRLSSNNGPNLNKSTTQTSSWPISPSTSTTSMPIMDSDNELTTTEMIDEASDDLMQPKQKNSLLSLILKTVTLPSLSTITTMETVSTTTKTIEMDDKQTETIIMENIEENIDNNNTINDYQLIADTTMKISTTTATESPSQSTTIIPLIDPIINMTTSLNDTNYDANNNDDLNQDQIKQTTINSDDEWPSTIALIKAINDYKNDLRTNTPSSAAAITTTMATSSNLESNNGNNLMDYEQRLPSILEKKNEPRYLDTNNDDNNFIKEFHNLYYSNSAIFDEHMKRYRMYERMNRVMNDFNSDNYLDQLISYKENEFLSDNNNNNNDDDSNLQFINLNPENGNDNILSLDDLIAINRAFLGFNIANQLPPIIR